MVANVIYRGPATATPRTVNKEVAGAYLPGLMMVESASALTLAVAADIEKPLVILGIADYVGQDPATAYASGDTGVAYRPQPGEDYQVRLAGATYAADAPLTVGASGYLEAAASGERIMAYFKGTAGAVSAGTLTDVRIANSFNLA